METITKINTMKKEDVIKILNENTKWVGDYDTQTIGSCRFEEIAERIVKLCNIQNVTDQRELLINFLEWYHKPDNCIIGHIYPDLAEQYLKFINSR